jgi:hypothetical protein
MTNVHSCPKEEIAKDRSEAILECGVKTRLIVRCLAGRISRCRQAQSFLQTLRRRSWVTSHGRKFGG